MDRVIAKPIISADSHIMEPPDTYSARIDRKYKETAPHVIWDERRGDTYVVSGMTETVPMGLIAAAGKSAEELAGAAAHGTRRPALPIRIATASRQR